MDYEKLNMKCQEDCYLCRMEGTEKNCLLDLERFKEHRDNGTLEYLKCMKYVGDESITMQRIWRQLEAEKQAEDLDGVDREIREAIIVERRNAEPAEAAAAKVMAYATFEEYDRAFETEVRKEGEAFIRIGYLLRVGMDTNIIKESGYASVAEYARKRFQIDETWAGRYIKINQRFSKGGYSDEIAEEYRGYGIAKLDIMRQLPDGIIEELSPAYSKSEILTLKEEADEEQKTSDLEILMQERDDALEEKSLLEKAVYQLLKDNRGWYEEIWEICGTRDSDPDDSAREIYEVLAPDEEAMHTVLIPGTGRVVLSLKGMENPVTATILRSGEKEKYELPSLLEAVDGLQHFANGMTYRESWEETYQESWPDGERKDTASPFVAEKGKKPATRKEGKVHKAKIPDSAPVQKGQGENPEPETTENQEEPQIPGQAEIADYPEYMPDGMVETIPPQGTAPENLQTESREPENAINAGRGGGIEPGGNVFAMLTDDEWNGAWGQLGENMKAVSRFYYTHNGDILRRNMGREELKQAYTKAVSLAAALERLYMAACLEGKQESQGMEDGNG